LKALLLAQRKEFYRNCFLPRGLEFLGKEFEGKKGNFPGVLTGGKLSQNNFFPFKELGEFGGGNLRNRRETGILGKGLLARKERRFRKI